MSMSFKALLALSWCFLHFDVRVAKGQECAEAKLVSDLKLRYIKRKKRNQCQHWLPGFKYWRTVTAPFYPILPSIVWSAIPDLSLLKKNEFIWALQILVEFPGGRTNTYRLMSCHTIWFFWFCVHHVVVYFCCGTDNAVFSSWNG